jgi:single-strand DNA-binding protein
MANLNKVMLIGRLTRKPEAVNFSNGGKVAKFGFAVNNRKKDPNSGEWVDDPVFLDVEAFNRGEFGKKADLVMQYLDKGKQVFIEGHLRMDQWEKDGQKRNKLVIVLDDMQFLDSRQDGGMSEGGGSRPAPARASAPARNNGSHGDYDEPEPTSRSAAGGGAEDDIPF